MKNTALFLNLIDRYNTLSYTHNYIFGFQYKGNIYMAFIKGSDLPSYLKLDVASRGAGYALRFCPTTEQKVALLTNSVVLCSRTYFDAEVADSKYNKGEIFEKLVTEIFGKQTWEKDNVPFTDDGDLTVDEVAYQIKYEKATFTTEKTLAHLESVLG